MSIWAFAVPMNLQDIVVYPFTEGSTVCLWKRLSIIWVKCYVWKELEHHAKGIVNKNIGYFNTLLYGVEEIFMIEFYNWQRINE